MTKVQLQTIAVFVFAITSTTTCLAGSLKRGQSFLEARKTLIHHKWTPVQVSAGAGYEYVGLEKTLVEAHFLEVENCSTDRAICIFNYRKNQQCLRIFTEGEELSTIRVRSWENTCPERSQ